MTAHYHVPAHMTKRSDGNVKACCERPAVDHLPFRSGRAVVIRLTRELRTVGGRTLPRGTILAATLDGHTGMAQVRRSRWGTNELGQFAELDRGEYADVTLPGYTVRVDGYSIGLPVSYAREISDPEAVLA